MDRKTENMESFNKLVLSAATVFVMGMVSMWFVLETEPTIKNTAPITAVEQYIEGNFFHTDVYYNGKRIAFEVTSISSPYWNNDKIGKQRIAGLTLIEKFEQVDIILERHE